MSDFTRVHLDADRKNRVYVAGPMTGYENLNFPAFDAAEVLLKAQGWHVENPASHGIVEGASWEDYLRFDIAKLSSCEAIYLLAGWSASRGARLEVMIAETLGVRFLYAPDAERVDERPDAGTLHRRDAVTTRALAKQFYNLIRADPEVEVRALSQSKLDQVDCASEQLRSSLEYAPTYMSTLNVAALHDD